MWGILRIFSIQLKESWFPSSLTCSCFEDHVQHFGFNVFSRCPSMLHTEEKKITCSDFSGCICTLFISNSTIKYSVANHFQQKPFRAVYKTATLGHVENVWEISHFQWAVSSYMNHSRGSCWNKILINANSCVTSVSTSDLMFKVWSWGFGVAILFDYYS